MIAILMIWAGVSISTLAVCRICYLLGYKQAQIDAWRHAERVQNEIERGLGQKWQ
jgi:hypothetical protein